MDTSESKRPKEAAAKVGPMQSEAGDRGEYEIERIMEGLNSGDKGDNKVGRQDQAPERNQQSDDDEELWM